MKRRWNNIFRKDNKSFILAMDHGLILDVGEKLRSPGNVIEKAVLGGVDAILTSYGIAQNYQKEIGNIGLLLRVDGGTTTLHPDGFVFRTPTKTFTVEDAVRIGADGIMCMGFLGLPGEENIIQNLGYFAGECNKYNLVFGVEMVPGGFEEPQKNTVENIAISSRVGAEYGADFVKTTFVGDVETFRNKVVEPCFKPIVVLGGGGEKSDLEVLTMVRSAMDAGCKGVAIGRSIWTHSDIEHLCRAISVIIHEDYSVDEALEILSELSIVP